MKKQLLLLLIFISFIDSVIHSQYFNKENMFYTIGVKNDQLFVTNESQLGNGIGISFESYVHFGKSSIAIFSLDYYSNVNIVEGSEVGCRFWTFYYVPLDWRFKIYRSPTGRANLYWGLSIAPQMMKVEGTKGVDWSWVYTFSTGFQYALNGRSFLQLQVKPYLVTGNQFAENGAPGLEAKLSYGFMLIRSE